MVNAASQVEPAQRAAGPDRAAGRPISAARRCSAASSLTGRRGETVAVIGESGCGKTVLLEDDHRAAAPHPRHGLLRRPRPVQAEREGADAAADPLRVPLPAGGPVRQHDRRPERRLPAASAHRTARSRKSSRSSWPRLAEVGLPEDVLGKKPAELSGGMRKRVGLARALALEPEIMLYDEPTTGLDPIMGDVINELILSTRRRHPVTSIVVTHDMRTAQKVADRVVMLYPTAAAPAGRAADPLRRAARADRAGRRPPRAAVRARARPASGSWKCGNRTGAKPWTNA